MNTGTEMEMFKRIASVKKLVVKHPSYEEALNAIETAFRMRKMVGVCETIFCLGQSGTGKTTLKRQLRDKYPPIETEERVLRPFVCVDTPSKPTTINMAEVLLQELGDPNYYKGPTGYTKKARLIKMLQELEVKYVVIDEVQHFIDHGNRKAAREVSDWLKEVINQTKACFVLMGLERAEQIRIENEQFRRRGLRVKLPPFSIAKKKDASVFACVIQQLDLQLGTDKRIELSPQMLKRFHFATNGIMDYLVKLLIGSYIHCVQGNLLGISEEVLESAFTKCIWDDGIGKLNPFSEKFCWLRLDKPGMPFYRMSAPEADVVMQ